MLKRAQAYGLTFLYPEHDTAVGPCLTRHGEFARPQLDFLVNQASGEAGVFVDAGANIGTISVPFARRRPDWRVLAIEAHRGLASILSANALSNGCDRVEVIHAAAGPDRRIAEFPTLPLDARVNVGTSSFYDRETPRLPVLMLPLDQIAPPDTRLVKVDVEGLEPEVLAGATRLINEVRPTWFVEAFYQAHRAGVMETFLRAGYAVYWFYAPWVTRAPLSGVRAEDDTVGDANFVCVPPGVAPAWALPPARPEDQSWPTDYALYPYLKEYGY
ncbi:MAG: FkbM family methyltransferase [Phenylobacterium sp.]|uniref:FkbM family methyltransferase n=1 Tax=Phenylobacterium sp. TaxID=1871053 RepID=UPI001A3BAF64|nr:FkbM family methyltransferase [Phenylobacterium sp.]MBL8555853.1 FkbM family methyltransferase [Phenylobacterium sp.]